MYQTLFRLPFLHVPIYGYGLMMVFAFLGCQWLGARLAAARGLDPEVFVNATLIALVSGVVGSRLSHVLENLHDYTRPELGLWANAWNMVNIRSGGLTLYGGLILATPVTLAYFVRQRVPWRLALDVAAPCVALGIGVGRLGCFLNGCCYGADTNLPWGVTFPYGSNAYVDQFAGSTAGGSAEHLRNPPPPSLFKYTPAGQQLRTPDEVKADPELAPVAAANRSNPVHPTQLYSTFNALLIMALVLAYIAGPHPAGRGLALLLLLEGPTRFLLELLRVEPAVLGPMSLSMVLGLALFAAGLALWFLMGPRRGRPAEFPLHAAV